VVEPAMLLGGVTVTVHELEEVLSVPSDVAIKVQTQESRKLDESRIHFAEEAPIIKRHRRDHISPEPIGAALLGKMIDDGWGHTCSDRSAHQDHGCWHVWISSLLHEQRPRQVPVPTAGKRPSLHLSLAKRDSAAGYSRGHCCRSMTFISLIGRMLATCHWHMV